MIINTFAIVTPISREVKESAHELNSGFKQSIILVMWLCYSLARYYTDKIGPYLNIAKPTSE